MEFNRFYRIIRDKYITNATSVEDLELLEELDSISEEQINYLFRTLSITENFKKEILFDGVISQIEINELETKYISKYIKNKIFFF